MDKFENTILYIDDEETNIFLFKETFSEYFIVTTALNTKEAREIMAQQKIKVVLTDLRMPEENGLEFINKVSPEYPEVYFVLLTAFLDINTAMQAINQGSVYRYLLKPWDENEIFQTINNAISSYDLKSENTALLKELKLKNTQLQKTLAELEEREKQFHNIFNSSSDGIVIFNKELKILLANPVFHKFINSTQNGDINITKFLHEKSLDILNSRFSQSFTKKLPMTEYEVTSPSGELRFIEANSTKIKYFGEDVLLCLLRDITDRKLIDQRILNEVIQAEERERNRLASDLHDGLGPILSTLKMYIEWITDKSRVGNVDQILDLSTKTIDEAIIQLRAISHNLSPHILEKFGLVPALQSQLEMIKPTSSIEFTLYSDLKERLPSFEEISLFRIIKECMNNSIKHSKANKASINIHKNKELLMVNYTDDGVGFDIAEISSKNKGIGLYNIKNRIKTLGGDVEITSAKGKGSNININILIKS